MLVGQNLATYFFSLGGAIFFALVFVFALFGAEILYFVLRRSAKKSRYRTGLFAGDADEGQCPL